MRRLWKYLVLDAVERIEREHREYLARPESRRPDVKVIVVLITAAIVLTLQHYFASGYVTLVADLLRLVGLTGPATKVDAWASADETSQIASLLWWALFSFATYFFIPWLMIALVFRERLADYGMKPHGALRDWPIYVVFFAVMFPLLLWVSTHEHFQRTYPFYNLGVLTSASGKVIEREPLWPYFWQWEAAYFVQFIGLEFFFRGFMTHGLKHRFGVYAIFVMAVPYCMIHYQKPILETCGAIIAGIVLGFMSLRTRSIWLGAAIHMSVAVSMDFLSLWRKGYFG